MSITTLSTVESARALGVGDTPLLQLPSSIVSEGRVFAKMEKCNPFSSIKDRVAWYMLAGAESRGELKPGSGTVIEATSGNTGIALAGFASARGYSCIIVMPDSASAERIALLNYLGAEVVLTPSVEGYAAAIEKAEQIHQQTPGSWFACQHENADNVTAHYETTGPELWQALGDELEVLVCGVGTGGTISGIARYLKEQNPAIHVVAVEPSRSAVLSGEPGGIHRIPGLNGGFVAPTTDRSVIDQVITVSDENAWETTRQLATAGIFVGISSGAAAHACKVYLEGPSRATTVATIFPDTGERYTSLLNG